MDEDKAFEEKVNKINTFVESALSISASQGNRDLTLKDDEGFSVGIRSTDKEFIVHTGPGTREGVEITLPELYLGGLGKNIGVLRSLASKFNAHVISAFNDVPINAYPDSTEREVNYDYVYRRLKKIHPELDF